MYFFTHACTECKEEIKRWKEEFFKEAVEEHYSRKHGMKVEVFVMKGLEGAYAYKIVQKK